MSNISEIRLPSVQRIDRPTPKSPISEKRPVATGLGDMVKGFINDVNTSHIEASQTVEDVVTGKSDQLHKAVISMNKAEMSFRYMMEVRSKVLQAYQEIQRMQL